MLSVFSHGIDLRHIMAFKLLSFVFYRKIMKWVLPKARLAVGRREWGKV